MFGCFGRSTNNCTLYSGGWEVKDPTRLGFLKDAFALIPPEMQKSIRNKGRYLESIGLLKMDISLFAAF